MTTLAFDVYGTLIDTAGVTTTLANLLAEPGDEQGDECANKRANARAATRAADYAAEFADRWRSKQLEYSFRYGLMGEYPNFRTCTRQALDYCCALLQADFTPDEREGLMAQYLTLPVFGDVVAGLDLLNRGGDAQARIKMYALSNGTAADLEKLLTHANIVAYFDGVISVDEVSTFKPNPAVYRHFLKRTGAPPEDAWLISSNPFDICGARAVGMQAVWMRRHPQPFDPWEYAPTHQVATFSEMAALFKS